MNRSFRSRKGATVENQVGTSGLDLYIALETISLYLYIRITTHCHIVTFYFHPPGPATFCSLSNR